MPLCYAYLPPLEFAEHAVGVLANRYVGYRAYEFGASVLVYVQFRKGSGFVAQFERAVGHPVTEASVASYRRHMESTGCGAMLMHAGRFCLGRRAVTPAVVQI